MRAAPTLSYHADGDGTGGDGHVSEQARILVVDDIPQNVKLLADLLGVKGYAVATAVNGEEALAKVAAERPDLVLLDVMALVHQRIARGTMSKPSYPPRSDR